MPKGKPLVHTPDPDMVRFMRQLFGAPKHAYDVLALGETRVQGVAVDPVSFGRIWANRPAKWAHLKIWRRNLHAWVTHFMTLGASELREVFGRDYRLVPGVHFALDWEPFTGEEDLDTGEALGPQDMGRRAPGRPRPAEDVVAMTEM